MKLIKKISLLTILIAASAPAAQAPKSKQEEMELARAMRASRLEWSRAQAPKTPAKVPASKPAGKPAAPQQSNLERAIAESKQEEQLRIDLERARLASLIQEGQEEEKKEGESQTNIRVRIVKAPQQINSECGYHAARNTAIRLSELSGQKFEGLTINDLKAIIEPKRIKEYQKLAELAHKKGRVQESIQFASKEPGVQLLDSQEVECVAGLLGLRGESYSIIPDIHTVKQELLTDKALDAIKKLQSQEGYCHSFMIGNMSQKVIAGAAVGSIGHWISIVACRQQGIIQCEVRDSNNGNPKEMIDSFKKLLMLDTAATDIDFIMERFSAGISENIAHGNGYRALFTINRMLDELQIMRYLHNAHLRKKYEKQIRTWLDELKFLGFDIAGPLAILNAA